jgi:hypothetical protein
MSPLRRHAVNAHGDKTDHHDASAVAIEIVALRQCRRPSRGDRFPSRACRRTGSRLAVGGACRRGAGLPPRCRLSSARRRIQGSRDDFRIAGLRRQSPPREAGSSGSSAATAVRRIGRLSVPGLSVANAANPRRCSSATVRVRTIRASTADCARRRPAVIALRLIQQSGPFRRGRCSRACSPGVRG